ncbi:hypothetical protein NA57DRAFT_80857 [Rhizodiscina lignyota]|uniref:Uncharacterized protein n=1 Tax=Rhizodiscina lignyota TaxID=1504668 RepID=A0A9P4I891_9PEZI|nr:hypothetical protein NA57DRAFT_80857 [Rhizodiscina lignyota]
MRTLRKRANDIDYAEDKENRDVNPQPKRAKKSSAETKKSKASAQTVKKGGSSSKKSPEKLYNGAVTSIEKAYKSLEKKIKPNFGSVTSDSFADAMVDRASTAKALLNMPPDGGRYAFNLLMYLGDNSYGGQDLSYTTKFCGCGAAGSYSKLDELMLQAIDACIEAEKGADNSDPTSTTEENAAAEQAFVDEQAAADELAALERAIAHKSRPNKSEYNERVKWRRAAFREKVENARRRRDVVVDWKTNALKDLEETKEHLSGFGIDKYYFPKSISKMRELTGQSADEDA